MLEEKNIIVGAGISGLTLGRELVEKNKRVILIEKEAEVGGLARTFRYNGFAFDIGPHRFHTDDEEVLKYIKDVLDNEYTTIDRCSAVYLFNKYFSWPLQFKAIFRLPFKTTLSCLKDLVIRKNYNGESFEDYIKTKYGPTLYDVFFKNYTEKFLFEKCNNIHQDWAEAGINRAVIDKRVKADNILSIALNTLLPKPVKTKFIYPAKGIDEFNKKLAQKIKNQGGVIKTGVFIKEIKVLSNKINKIILNNNEEIEADKIFWTGSIGNILELLNMPRYDLKFIALLCYNIEINKEINNSFQWCYYGGKTIFSRISIPKNFSREIVPIGKSSLCVEVTCREGEDYWNNPEMLIDRLKSELAEIKLINKDDIGDIHIEKIKNAYPVYSLNYKKELEKAAQELDKIKNLYLFGRSGTFWYNNIDHSIKQVLDFTRRNKINKNRAL